MESDWEQFFPLVDVALRRFFWFDDGVHPVRRHFLRS